MSKLGQLLSYLERPDVTELVFRSGAPAVMRVGHRLHPITVSPLRTTQIHRFFEGTPLLRMLPTRGEITPQTHHLELQGRSYRIVIRGKGAAIELRMSRVGSGEHERAPDVMDMHPTSGSRPSGEPATPEPAAPQVRQRRATPVPQAPSGVRHADAPTPRPTPISRPSIPRDAERQPDAPEVRTAAVDKPLLLPRRPTISTERAPSSPSSRDRLTAVRIRPGSSASPASSNAPSEPEAAEAFTLEVERNDDLHASHHGGASASAHQPSETSSSDYEQDAVPRLPSPTVSNATVMPSLGHEQGSGRSAASRADAVPTPILNEPGSYRPPTAPNPTSMPSLSRDEATATTRADALGPSTRAVEADTPAPIVEPRYGAPMHPRLRQLLADARSQGVSDVHIMAEGPVRVRTAGALEPQGDPIPAHEVETMLAPLLRPRHAEQLTRLGYADLGVEVHGAGRLRVNVSRQRTGLKICVRLVVTEPVTLDALGLPSEVRKLTTHHQGMVLIAGPNGHGKTTTMAALVDLFNAQEPLHIITVEDPVEVIHPRKKALMTQRELGTHTLSFPAALAAALREDPDVIAIGELRDRETVEMALSAAETGHLVLATMSTPSGAKTIDRVIDMFPPDEQSQVRATMSGALKLVLSQRLVRRADGQGLVAAYEMITGNVPLWSLIRDDKLFQLPSLLQRGRNYGMIRLEDSLRDLMSRGLITETEARLNAEDPRALTPPPAAAPAPGRFGR